MTRFLKICDQLSRLAETLAVVLIFGYCILMLAEVVGRAQARSFSFSWEYSQYAMAAIFALASGPAIRAAVHVRITLVTEFLSKRTSRWLDIVANVIALAITALLVSAMLTKVGTSFDRNILATTVTKTQLWIPQIFVLWGLAQLFLDLAARLFRRWRNEEYEWRRADAEVSDA